MYMAMWVVIQRMSGVPTRSGGPVTPVRAPLPVDDPHDLRVGLEGPVQPALEVREGAHGSPFALQADGRRLASPGVRGQPVHRPPDRLVLRVGGLAEHALRERGD